MHIFISVYNTTNYFLEVHGCSAFLSFLYSSLVSIMLSIPKCGSSIEVL